MKEQFVTYEIALSVKELGFNEECLACYSPHLGNGVFELTSKGSSNEKSSFNERFIKAGSVNGCSAPLWQQVIDWFRERYNLHLVPIYSYNDILHWSYHIEDIVTGECYIPLIDNGLTLKSTKYEAREQAILKAIELCKQKKN